MQAGDAWHDCILLQGGQAALLLHLLPLYVAAVLPGYP